MTILSKLTLTKKTKATMPPQWFLGIGAPLLQKIEPRQIQFATAKTEGTGGLQTTPNLLRHNP